MHTGMMWMGRKRDEEVQNKNHTTVKDASANARLMY